ncbi:hypothetical protein FGL86_11660 [Pistricoccus aurantiacus]|uniref:Uncharacterized protein n=1 Tax=Pistricoccus aurantiacus TaxID=1883414 RepID=A0A5B8SR65_9GAMM|nr:hypothetical protein [Pistricoccus aurantiacus]QEA39659.1 hypothetical protein FGL86_11660 [Pistricoccus aurantiacus]
MDTSISRQRLARLLDNIAPQRALAVSIVYDNGPELISKAMFFWARERKSTLAFIQPEQVPAWFLAIDHELSKMMPNLQSIELQAMGHNPATECRSTVIDAFLAEPDAPVDTSCRTEVALEDWQLK